MFDDFTLEYVTVDGVDLRVRHGGHGPAVVLLHGHPRTHTTWYAVAPLLATTHTVVCPDLRGYGRSSKPPTDEHHTPYSKSAMAADIVGLMHILGHDEFAVVGHDRGSQVAFRLALEHPASVQCLVFIGSLPIGDILARCTPEFATAWWHWFFFAQPDTPERVINADPDAWYRTQGKEAAMGPANYEDYLAAVHDPATVHAMLEDYRAGLTIDREHDDADRAAGHKVSCPVLHIWALRDDPPELFANLRETWRAWADDVQMVTIDAGHHVAEEAPQELARLIGSFLAADDGQHDEARHPIRANRITANLRVADIETAKSFYTDYLGLSTEEFNLGWVARYTSPDTGTNVQLVTRDATAAEDSVMSIHTDNVDSAYEEAQKLGYEIVHPITTEPWGVRRFFVRAPDGNVINIVSHRD